MKLSEVSLMTQDVSRLAGIYKGLLGVENDSDDAVHQFVTASGIAFTIYKNGSPRGEGRNACQSFLVDDIDAEYARLLSHGVTVTEPPKARPWGMKNLCFMDPDGNRMYLAMPLATQWLSMLSRNSAALSSPPARFTARLKFLIPRSWAILRIDTAAIAGSGGGGAVHAGLAFTTVAFTGYLLAGFPARWPRPAAFSCRRSCLYCCWGRYCRYRAARHGWRATRER